MKFRKLSLLAVERAKITLHVCLHVATVLFREPCRITEIWDLENFVASSLGYLKTNCYTSMLSVDSVGLKLTLSVFGFTIALPDL